MQTLIVLSAILAFSAAVPVYLSSEVHLPLGKTTVTKSSQVVDHGSTYIHHPVVPVVHAALHTPVIHVSVPAKSTLTKSSQVVNHGSSSLVHVPVVHAPVVHAAPVYFHSSPLVAVKRGDSAVSHHSSTVHETVPLVTVHH